MDAQPVVHAYVGGRGNRPGECARPLFSSGQTIVQPAYSAALWGCGKVIRADFRGYRGRMRKLQTDRTNGCAEGRG